MIAPITMSWMYEDTLIRLSPLPSTAMTTTPRSVRTRLPSPPPSRVPPITTAAIAYSSRVSPTVGCPESVREVITIPATPAQKPEKQ